jgi:hypothetical protein
METADAGDNHKLPAKLEQKNLKYCLTEVENEALRNSFITTFSQYSTQ